MGGCLTEEFSSILVRERGGAGDRSGTLSFNGGVHGESNLAWRGRRKTMCTAGGPCPVLGSASVID